MKKKFLLFIGMFLIGIGSYAQLNGTYTIDPTKDASGTNYMDIKSAVNDLQSGYREDGGPAQGWGISGPVVFNLADGDYQTNFEIGAIVGVKEDTTVTFQSASGDNTAVRIFGSQQNDLGVIKFNGASYVTLNKLTIDGTDEEYSSRSKALYFSGTCHFNKVTNCVLKSAETSQRSSNYCAVYMNGSNVRYNEFSNNHILNGSYGMYMYYTYYNLIENNTFDSQYYRELHLDRTNSTKVIGNKFVSSDYRYSENYAINLNYCNDSLKILNNEITGKFRYGIFNYRTNYNPTTTTTALIANNAISIPYTGSYNCYAIQCNDNEYVDYINNSINNQNGYSNDRAYNTTGSSNIRLINNIFSTKTGYSIYVNGFTDGTCDYNNYYTESAFKARWNTTDYSSIEEYRTASGMDVNSISVYPRFVSDSDLHTFEKALNETGDNSVNALVSTDIDGDIRDASKPDIGADEFDLIIDIGLSNLEIGTEKLCLETTDVFATIKNSISDTVFSANINWTVNGVAQTTFVWSDTLLTDSSLVIKIGSFIPAEDTSLILAYTSAPNGELDVYNANDTLSLIAVTGMAGEYTIGGSDPDFETIKSAIDVLEERGVCDAVVFKIRDGEYHEKIYLQEIDGASETNTITFESESKDSSKVIINYSSSYVVALYNADYYVFNNLGFESGNGKCIYFYGNSHYNSFNNCWIKGIRTVSTSDSYSVVYAYNVTDSCNTFSNNVIENGSYGVYWNANSSNRDEKNVFEGNIFKNNYRTALYLNNQNNLTVSDNYVKSDSENDDFSGLGISYTDNSIVTRNQIYASENGIFLYEMDGAENATNTIGNNIVYLDHYGDSYGIKVTTSDYVDVFNNTISVKSGYAFYETSGNDIRVKNNIFKTSSGAPYYTAYAGDVVLSDYNNLYSEDGLIANLGTTPFADIESWRTATGMSASSISLSPDFVSDTNLHVSNIAFNNYGDTIPDVLATDIDGVTRDLNHPDLGAYEFIPE